MAFLPAQRLANRSPVFRLHDLYTLLLPITVPKSSPRARFSNWGESFYCTPLAVFEPETEYQCELIIELARRERRVVTAAGIGHSPSDLACTTGFLLRTGKLNRVLEVDAEKCYVVAQAGITLHDLHQQLALHNLAMMNVGSISDQTLGGVVTTATHGSGINFGVISTHVVSLTLLLADGSRVTCSRAEHGDLFAATICGLGTTGLVLCVKLQVEPAFLLKEVQESLPFEKFITCFDELVQSAEHTRFWWFPPSDTVRCSYPNRTLEPRTVAVSWFWDIFMAHHLYQFLLFLSRYFSSLQVWLSHYLCWLAGSRTVRVDKSHNVFNLDCRYRQFTTEWAIPYQHARVCLQEIRTWLDQERTDPEGIRPHSPVEIRFSAPDNIWLSPSNGRSTCWIGLIQFKPYGFTVPYRRYFTGYEKIVARHQGRPHWAKAHNLRPDTLRQLYPCFDDFLKVIQHVDPDGMFRNEYIQRHLYPLLITQ